MDDLTSRHVGAGTRLDRALQADDRHQRSDAHSGIMAPQAVPRRHWTEEPDRDYWLELLWKAVKERFNMYTCTCYVAGTCRWCKLSEALSYTDPSKWRR